MKVQGVDPLIMNRIQEQTSKQSVQEMKQARISGDHDKKRKKKQPEPDKVTLAASVAKLNKAAEALNIQVFFEIERADGENVVLMIDKAEQNVIRRIPAIKIADMLAQIKNMMGMLVDQLI